MKYREIIKWPEFLIGGASRSGTTSLLMWLNAHPEIYIPQKEPNYFAFCRDEDFYTKIQGKHCSNLTEYLQFYTFTSAKANLVTGEKSVSYLYGPWSERVINSILEQHPFGSELKIIFILRQPLERLFSQYLYNLSFDEDLPLEEAIKAWEWRMEEAWIPAYDYIGGSLYADGLKKYMRTFKNVKVLFFDDLKSNPENLIRELLEFIGVESRNSNEYVGKVHNSSGIPGKSGVGKGIGIVKKTAMWSMGQQVLSPGVKSWLKEKVIRPFLHKPVADRELMEQYLDHFMEDIDEIEKLTGRDLAHWKRIS